MGMSNGIVVGCFVRDRFPGERAVEWLEVVAHEPGASVSPEGYNLIRLRKRDGSTFVTSAYDCVREPRVQEELRAAGVLP